MNGCGRFDNETTLEKCTFLMLRVIVRKLFMERRVGRGLDVMVAPLEVLVQVGNRI